MIFLRADAAALPKLPRGCLLDALLLLTIFIISKAACFVSKPPVY
jgi:hypothetical protein